MDEPLFGEEERRLLTWALMAVVVGFVAFSVLILVVFGVKHGIYQHFLEAALLVAVFAALVLLYRWYAQGDLDPKFKWLLLLIIAVTLYAGVVANAYAWKPLPVIPGSECSQLYNREHNACVYISDFDKCAEHLRGYCIIMSGPTSGICRNCTATKPTPSPPRMGDETFYP